MKLSEKYLSKYSDLQPTNGILNVFSDEPTFHLSGPTTDG